MFCNPVYSELYFTNVFFLALTGLQNIIGVQLCFDHHGLKLTLQQVP